MSLFQNSVLNKYLKGLESEKVNEAYERFTIHFHNPTIQENIRNSKEEQYQGEFLINLFVNVLGYVKNPTPDFNLTTELKNIKGSKKTDGAILKGEKALAVIELKGTYTTDLSKVETQAFGYKNNQPDCNYVITSNFEKLRFYIDNAVDFEEFNLFQLTRERFDILWLCLSSEYLLKDIPKKIKDESLTKEENITKELYKDYASFRNEIFDSIQKENPEYDKLTLFKKTQKLLDRFLFIFFAEDRLLLPPNLIRSIVNQWTDLRDKYDEYFPLYNRFQKHFGYMNTGHKEQQHDIFAYNGGLFAPDEILDNIKINDDLLYKHTVNLSNYDFESEVSVNILGHIFEHSLNDIDEIQAKIQDVATETKKTKRKKDGVFYTPKYITKYIVDNTVGKLCEEKKIALDIQEVEYEKERKGRQKATLKKLSQKLENYRKWLLQITICDPACGSGAFLNQSLEFLISEHRYIDELQAKLFGDAMILSEVENSILENNIYGVDINEESVDIAKLSLWLRTAQKGRKLTSLNNNIKCGNSLIDSKAVAGYKAFNWEKEFPQIFEKDGFDVVIGNPPYGANLSDDEKEYFRKEYPEIQFKIDTYSIFVLKIYQITKLNGIAYYIIPNTLLDNYFEEKVRMKILTKSELIEIVDLDDKVFEDAVVHSMVIGIRNFYQENYNVKISSTKELGAVFEEIPVNYLKTQEKMVLAIRNYRNRDILDKLFTNSIRLKEVIDIRQTIKTGNDKIHIVDTKLAENYKPVIAGRDMNKWLIKNPGLFVNYGKHLACPRDPKIFEQPKILIREAGDKITATYDDSDFYIMSSLYACILIDEKFSLKYILSLLNSSLFQFQLRLIAFDKTKGAFTKARIFHYYELPTKIIDKVEQLVFVEKVDLMISLTEKFNVVSTRFSNYLQSQFSIEKLPKKLQNWHELEFGDFIKELKKYKIVLSLKEKAEWMEYFNNEKEIIQKIKSEIEKVDSEIDQIVYQLYDLTENEIKIVEKSTA